jgi:hypothetical protein
VGVQGSVGVVHGPGVAHTDESRGGGAIVRVVMLKRIVRVGHHMNRGITVVMVMLNVFRMQKHMSRRELKPRHTRHSRIHQRLPCHGKQQETCAQGIRHAAILKEQNDDRIHTPVDTHQPPIFSKKVFP